MREVLQISGRIRVGKLRSNYARGSGHHEYLSANCFCQNAILYRSRYVLKNSILFKPDLPIGYYEGGDFSTQCESPKDASIKKFNEFKYCEDAALWNLHDGDGRLAGRQIIISCDAGRREWNTVLGPMRNPDPLGSLWVYTPNPKSGSAGANSSEAQGSGGFWEKAKLLVKTAKAKLQRVTLKGFPEGHDFHPLGLEIYPSYAGNSSYLYVINHARERTVIEQFIVSPSSPTTAEYIRTLSSSHFTAPNALALTSPSSFYVSNDHLLPRRIPFVGPVLATLESVFGLPTSWVGHVTVNPDPLSEDPIQSYTYVARGIPFANGVALSPSGDELAVASSSLGHVHFYTRDITTNALTYKDRVLVPFTPDNIRFTEDGTLYVAGHPHFPTLLKFAAGKTTAAPSWVIAVSKPSEEYSALAAPPKEYDTAAPVSVGKKVPGSLNYEVRTVFQSNGTGFPTSTTALYDEASGELFLTGLYAENGAMVCRPAT